MRTHSILTWLAVLYLIATVAVTAWSLFVLFGWYMDLFYGEPWFKHVEPEHQVAIRTFIDSHLGQAVWPLVTTNAIGVALVLVLLRMRKRGGA